MQSKATKLALIAFLATLVAAARVEAPVAARARPMSVAAVCAEMQPAIDVHAYPGQQVRIQHPSIRTYVTPDYPTLPRKAHGVVSVCALVSEAGRATRLRIARSSGSSGIDESALRATRQTQFHPGKVNGRPQPMVTELDYTFDLK